MVRSQARAVTLILAILASFLASVGALAQGSWLPSWNEGAAKQAIVEFVQQTTDPSSARFVPPGQRVAAFDQDGTLWVEHPLYAQVVFCLDQVPALVKQKPALTKTEPFRTVLSGDREALARLSAGELLKIVSATLTGMSVERFQAEVKRWLATARDACWKRPCSCCTTMRSASMRTVPHRGCLTPRLAKRSTIRASGTLGSW